MEFLSSAANTITNTLNTVKMSSQAGLEQLIECDTLECTVVIKDQCNAIQHSVGFSMQCIVRLCCALQYSSMHAMHCNAAPTPTLLSSTSPLSTPAVSFAFLRPKNFSREIILLFVRMAFKLSKSGDTPAFWLGLKNPWKTRIWCEYDHTLYLSEAHRQSLWRQICHVEKFQMFAQGRWEKP